MRYLFKTMNNSLQRTNLLYKFGIALRRKELTFVNYLPSSSTLPAARQASHSGMEIILQQRYYYQSAHFTDEETKAKRGETTSRRSNGSSVGDYKSMPEENSYSFPP